MYTIEKNCLDVSAATAVQDACQDVAELPLVWTPCLPVFFLVWVLCRPVCWTSPDSHLISFEIFLLAFTHCSHRLIELRYYSILKHRQYRKTKGYNTVHLLLKEISGWPTMLFLSGRKAHRQGTSGRENWAKPHCENISAQPTALRTPTWDSWARLWSEWVRVSEWRERVSEWVSEVSEREREKVSESVSERGWVCEKESFIQRLGREINHCACS